MVASVVSVFGPRCTLWLCARGMNGVVELTMTSDNSWLQTDFVNKMRNEVRVFAPANLRATQTSEGYAKMVDYFMKEKFTLRYSGGKVANVSSIRLCTDKCAHRFGARCVPNIDASRRNLYESSHSNGKSEIACVV